MFLRCYIINGIETAYAYDADGNISSIETKAGENVLLSFAYEYDGNGNRTAKTGMQMTAGSNALDISYGYDIRGQFLEERRNGASVQKYLPTESAYCESVFRESVSCEGVLVKVFAVKVVLVKIYISKVSLLILFLTYIDCRYII